MNNIIDTIKDCIVDDDLALTTNTYHFTRILSHKCTSKDTFIEVYCLKTYVTLQQFAHNHISIVYFPVLPCI